MITNRWPIETALLTTREISRTAIACKPNHGKTFCGTINTRQIQDYEEVTSNSSYFVCYANKLKHTKPNA